MMKTRLPFRSTFVVAILVTALAAGCSKDSPESMVESGKAYMSKDDPHAAALQFKNVLQKNPDNGEVRQLLGRALLDSGDVLGAEKELRRALELGYSADAVLPPLAAAVLRQGEYKKVLSEFGDKNVSGADGMAELKTAVGQAQLALGDKDAARRSFQEAQAANPRSARAILGEVSLLAAEGQLDKALVRADAAVALAPNKPDGWQIKGELLSSLGRSDEAMAAYREAIKAKKDFVPAHASLVSSLLQSGKREEAAKELDTLKTIAPKNPQTYYLQALALSQDRNYKAAREAVQESLRLAPDNLQATLLSAIIDFQLGSYITAETSLVSVLQRAPGDAYARRVLVGTYMARGQNEKAMQTLTPLLRRADLDAATLSLAGDVYLRNGQPSAAAGYFEKAKLLDPAGAVPRTGLALTHLAMGDTQRGAQELEAAAAADPGARTDVALITMNLQQGKIKEALAAIDKLEKKQPDKPFASYLRGLAMLASKDNASARKSFEQALKIDPKFFPAATSLVRLDLMENKPAEAEQKLRSFLQQDGSNPTALLALAELRRRAKAPTQEVTDLITKAISANPSAVEPRTALVGYFLSLKETKRAVAAAEEASTALPDRPEIIVSLGDAQWAAGDRNQALATYNRALQQQPNSPGLLLQVAKAKAALKDFDGAADSLRKALVLKPDLVDAQSALVQLDLQTNRANDALQIAREVQKQRPRQAVGYVLEGDIYASQKDWKQAIAAYRSGVRQAGTSDAAMRLHAAMLMNNQSAEASKTADAWLKDHPDDITYRAYLADAALRRGDYTIARNHYDELVRKQPNNPVLLNNLAWVAGKLNDPNAIAYAERANQAAPNQPQIMDKLVMLLIGRGDSQRAVELLKKATELAPEAASIRLHLAQALIKAGDKQGARKELEELAKLNDFAGQDEVKQLMKTL